MLNESKISNKIEKQDLNLNATLDKYFDKQKLTDEEMELVENYRQECIGHVKDNAYKFSEIGSASGIGFNGEGISAAAGLAMMIKSDDFMENKDSFLFELDSSEGMTVVDIGSGRQPRGMIHGVSNCRAKKYIAVDLEPPTEKYLKFIKNDYTADFEIESVKSDILKYLLKLDKESCAVVSSATLSREVMPSDKKGQDYIRFIAHEIYRVTPPGKTTYHYDSGMDFMLALQKEGFEEFGGDEKGSIDANKRSHLWIKPE